MWNAVTKPFRNIHRIFPLKQKAVYDLIEVCRQDSNIKKIIIFGSSITAACNPWSDIDVYFEMEKMPKHFPVVGNHEQSFDKWCNFTVSDELLHEINKKGVVVYGQG